MNRRVHDFIKVKKLNLINNKGKQSLWSRRGSDGVTLVTDRYEIKKQKILNYRSLVILVPES